MTSKRGEDIAQAYVKFRRQGSRWLCLVITCLLLAGCAATDRPAGPQTLAPYRSDPWDPRYPNTSCITSPNYRIFTDLRDSESIEQLVQVMEGAQQQYRVMCPALPVVAKPLRCYVFSRRDEWAAFTSRNAGKDSAIYLRINRGAYTIDDWFVAFWLGDRGTFATAAHEGWHQFVGRYFAARMPPALEEGIGCTFENIGWKGKLPRWDLDHSPARAESLRDAIRARQLWTMAELLRMHAGDVIKMPRERIDTFYAQNWAMALFLMRGNSPYRPAMDRYFAALADGTVYRPANLAHLQLRDWHPGLSGPQMEHYLGKTLSEVESEYRAFCLQLASH